MKLVKPQAIAPQILLYLSFMHEIQKLVLDSI